MSVNKTFVIPQPVIPSNQTGEYLAIRYKKILPTEDVSYTSLPNLFANQFTLTLDDNCTYQILASHKCSDGSSSDEISIEYNTKKVTPMVYVCLELVNNTDTCATITGNCRNCVTSKLIRYHFYSDAAGTQPLDVTGYNLVISHIITENGMNANPVSFNINNGITYDANIINVYQEMCNSTFNQSVIYNRSVTLVNGASLDVPYTPIPCPTIANNPTMTEISNTTTGIGGIRTHIFEIGNDIASGNKFGVGVYSHNVVVVATTADNPQSIVAKLVLAVNNTSAAQWNDNNSAPTDGRAGFKPTAIAYNSNQIKLTLDNQHQFYGFAQVS